MTSSDFIKQLSALASLDEAKKRASRENLRPQPDSLDNVGFIFFSDPDGNGWAVQQISSRN